MQDPLLLGEEFQEVLDLLEHTNENIFLTGKAGTGKSTLLQLFKKTTQKKTVVLAPTGVAALNVGGQTIHSFFSFAPKLMSSQEINPKKNRSILRIVEVIVIDEISMVRADLLDHIDHALRLTRGNDLHFGGVQMVFIGDLFQLPPVVSSSYERSYFQTVYETPYFFSAEVFKKGFTFQPVELNTVFRQEERRFINMLDAIRSGDIDDALLEELNEQVVKDIPKDGEHITLTTKNLVAQRINQLELDKIDEVPLTFQAEIKGHFNPSLYPTEVVLRLKKGARVMLIKNDPGRKYVNGTIGTIETIEPDRIILRIKAGGKSSLVEVSKTEWEILKYSSAPKSKEITTEVIGSFIQYPIKLAWAITVHKSQGKTFDQVLIDLKGGAFEHGQTYVALSRCRTLDGIILQQPVKYQDILVDEQIIDFYQKIHRY